MNAFEQRCADEDEEDRLFLIRAGEARQLRIPTPVFVIAWFLYVLLMALCVMVERTGLAT